MPANQEKRRRGTDNPRSEYVTRSFCDERFSRFMDKLEAIDKKIDELKEEKREESHALRNTVLALIVSAFITLLSYGLGRVSH